jgi:hypothetical protein
MPEPDLCTQGGNMSSTKSLMSVLTSMRWEDQVKLAETFETIRTAAAILSRPDVISCLAFLKEITHACGSLQASLEGAPVSGVVCDSSNDQAVAESMLYEAVNAVPLSEAIKAVAAQDASKAAAIQYAVKAVALKEAARMKTFSEEDMRSAVSARAAHAVAMLRHAEGVGRERRSAHDRRKRR